MIISVIIPTYNAEATLEQALQSVFQQDYPQIEVIIVDGGSTDGTMAVVERYHSRIARVIQEPDEGPFDAMNKGILASQGEVIGVLGADDYYLSPSVLRAVAEVFAEKPHIQAVYGDYLRDKGEEQRIFHHPDHLSRWTFFFRNPLCQQALFVRREVFDEVGLFDTSLKIASDHDWYLRAFGQHQVPHFHLPLLMCGFRGGGLSSTPASVHEHALVRRRYFPWPYELVWHGWDIGRRVLRRLF